MKFVLINSYDRPNKAEEDTDFTVYVNSEAIFKDIEEVAVSQIIMTNSWYNISSLNNTVIFQENIGAQATATITPGDYSYSELAPVLVSALNSASPNGRTYTASLSNITNKLTLSVNSGTFKILSSGTLNLMLGFSRSSDTASLSSVEAPRILNLARYGNLCLYSNIVRGEHYNTSLGLPVNLLESLPVGASGSGDIFTFIPPVLNFKPLAGKGSLAQIRLTLRDELNNLINLNGGYMSVILALK